MTDKKHTYQSNTMVLPSLKIVVGEIPDPDPDHKNRPFRRFNEDKSEIEARNVVAKLIGHLKSSEK